MGRDGILSSFDRLNVWSRDGQRAAQAAAGAVRPRPLEPGDTNAVPFRDVDRDLTPMLREFGPPRQSYHPEYPFWHLQNDGVWAVTAAGPLSDRSRESGRAGSP